MILGLTTIQRNRGPWLVEWLAFHHLVGFRRFYFYPHLCSDDTLKTLHRLKDKFNITTLTVPPKGSEPQLQCYRNAYQQFSHEIDWMAFLDGDEFLFPVAADSIVPVLEKFSDPKISALGVYWACFGSSNHLTEPPGLIIDNYKHRALPGYENDRHIKSLVRGNLGNSVYPTSPHYFRTPNGTYDENLRLITTGWTNYQPTYHTLQINHYVTQSRSYFENVKSQVGYPDGAPPRDESFWIEHNRNDVEDHSIDKFIKPLKKLINSL